MKFTVNRKILHEYLKSMIRVVPSGSPLPELRCFLVEVNEDDGHLYLTANNMESAIQRKFKVSVESEGSFLILAQLLLDIISLLGADDVVFQEEKQGFVTIKSGSTSYQIPTLSARNYPKPEMPFPEDMLKITGICDLYACTANTVSTNNTKLSLTGIHLDIYSDSVRAVSCDMHRMALANKEAECGGKLSVTIPKQSFYYLARAVGNDDVLEVGLDGKSIVFMKEGLLFSSRYIEEQFIDPELLLKSHDRHYRAEVEMELLFNAVDAAIVIARECEQFPRVQLQFVKGAIRIDIVGETAKFNVDVPALVHQIMDKPFFYPANNIIDLFKIVRGKAMIEVSSGGLLMVADEHNKNQYLVMNVRPDIQRTSKTKKGKKAA